MTPTSKETTEEKNMIRMRKKDGTEYVGTAYDCARVLMKDAWNLYFHRQNPMALWEVKDFCTKNDINYEYLCNDLGINRFYI